MIVFVVFVCDVRYHKAQTLFCVCEVSKEGGGGTICNFDNFMSERAATTDNSINHGHS